MFWPFRRSRFSIKIGSMTTVGLYRDHNEDHALLDASFPYVIVLDGMGGQGAGFLAASTGGEVFLKILEAWLYAGESPENCIRRALHSANDAVKSLHQQKELRGIGTTIVIATMFKGKVYVSWVGDSMAYRISRKQITPLTWKQDFRTMMCRKLNMSEEEANKYRWGNVLVHYLGRELPTPIEVISFKPKFGDQLILATDGMHGFVPTESISAICQQSSNPQTCAESLVQKALEVGSRDNVTCIVVSFAAMN